MLFFMAFVAIDPSLAKLGEEAIVRVLIAFEPLLLLWIAAKVAETRAAQKQRYKEQDKREIDLLAQTKRRSKRATDEPDVVPGQVRDVPEKSLGGHLIQALDFQEQRRDDSPANTTLRESDTALDDEYQKHKGAI
jgi:hypothetical protein